ncbi:1,2-phenylacetyl-CoA epoxidase subunit PaaC [Subtercola lobariae]|uniref:Phenylacetate-CoA oxygenase subunit PaaI n=1 Tax=Subtercola lobariae TaxID=1588641 RepID=A0A917ET24_9MICO|nr:1,2-phenylacetyl-CoA epoxidase subunit PaaC [Subtercola lobariae]GGF11773.1 phenylacetate-CoA oxygenase subunit PaaI [Subtercola lobariae]
MSVKQRQAPTGIVTPELIEAEIEGGLVATEAVAQYALGLGDDALILAHRLGEWIANGPELEEDIALGNIGLDILGHARSLLTYAGSAWGKTEDDLAYFRSEPEFRCRQLFEQPIGDFGQTIARQLIASVYFDSLYRALMHSSDKTLAAIAAKATKEVDYHLDHSTQWLLRLGLGTDESAFRMQRGLDAMWPFVDELYRAEPVASGDFGAELAEGLEGIAVDPRALRAEFDAVVPQLVRDAGLTVPQTSAVRGGGRQGIHSEAFGPLLAEMQVLARQHPGASW